MRYLVLTITLACWAPVLVAQSPAPSPAPSAAASPTPAASLAPESHEVKDHKLDFKKESRQPALLIRGTKTRRCQEPADVVDEWTQLDAVAGSKIGVVKRSHKESRCMSGQPIDSWKPGRDVAYLIVTDKHESGVAVWMHENDK